jgi:hypothetical protein
MSLILSGSDGLSDINGSASTPAIRGTDANTGIFFPAADTIAFAEGGVEAMRIDSDGDVGIGETAPAAKLHIKDSGDTTADGIRLTLGSEARDHNIYSSIVNGRDLTIAPWRSLTVQTGNGIAEGIITLNSYEYTVFGTGASNTERMRIDSSGNLLVGETAIDDSGGLAVIPGYATGAPALLAFNKGNSGSETCLRFKYQGTVVGSIAYSSTATAYNTSSDYRLKENIAPMTGALEKVSQLNPVTYTWKSTGEQSQGFIAHELQAIVPDCVTGEKDAVETYVDEEGVEQTRPVYQGIDTSFLVATLTAAIQELKAELDTVKAQNAAFEARLAALEAK